MQATGPEKLWNLSQTSVTFQKLVIFKHSTFSLLLIAVPLYPPTISIQRHQHHSHFVSCMVPIWQCYKHLRLTSVLHRPTQRHFLHTKCINKCMLTLWCPLVQYDHYSGRTAPLTSKRCILYIYSTNTGNEYFKHGIYSPFFSSSKCSLFHNSNIFGSCIIHILCTGCAKIKKIIPAPKG